MINSLNDVLRNSIGLSFIALSTNKIRIHCSKSLFSQIKNNGKHRKQQKKARSIRHTTSSELFYPKATLLKHFQQLRKFAFEFGTIHDEIQKAVV